MKDLYRCPVALWTLSLSKLLAESKPFLAKHAFNANIFIVNKSGMTVRHKPSLFYKCASRLYCIYHSVEFFSSSFFFPVPTLSLPISMILSLWPCQMTFFSFSPLIDTGAARNFIDVKTINHFRIPVQSLKSPLKEWRNKGGGMHAHTHLCCPTTKGIHWQTMFGKQ